MTWQTTTLGNHISLQRGQSYKSAFLNMPGPVLLGLGTIGRNGGFRGDNLRTYGGPTPPEILLGPGDVYVSLKDMTQAAQLLGAAAVVPPHISEARLTQDTVRLDVTSDALRRDFLGWALRTPRYRAYCRLRGTGTTNLDLSRNEFLAYDLPLPQLPEQQAIAEVLGALDDKIAANARLSVAIDELLSADFEREFGAVDMGPLAEIAEVNAIRARPESGEGLRYLDIASVGVGRIDQPSSILWDDAPGRARRGVRKGDTVWSTVRPNRRSHALVLDVSGPLIASTGLAVLSPVGCGPSFLYEATKGHAFGAYLENVAEGSAYPAVRADKFASAPVPRTEPQARDAFEHRAMPLRERQHTADMESIALAALRDALLPELMSGRLHVKDAERTVEEVI